LEELCSSPYVNRIILDELNDIARDHKRPRYEWIRKIHLFPKEFSVENDLATPTMKLKRAHLQKFFKDEVDAIYE